MSQTPNYVARHSAWAAITFWRIILCILIIPIFIIIFDIIGKKHDVIEFYDDYIIQKSGVLSKKEKRTAFNGILNVSVSQTLWQRICRYGDVQVDVPGKWDIDTEGIANPNGLKEYLENKFVKSQQVTSVIAN